MFFFLLFPVESIMNIENNKFTPGEVITIDSSDDEPDERSSTNLPPAPPKSTSSNQTKTTKNDNLPITAVNKIANEPNRSHAINANGNTSLSKSKQNSPALLSKQQITPNGEKLGLTNGNKPQHDKKTVSQTKNSIEVTKSQNSIKPCAKPVSASNKEYSNRKPATKNDSLPTASDNEIANEPNRLQPINADGSNSTKTKENSHILVSKQRVTPNAKKLAKTDNKNRHNHKEVVSQTKISNKETTSALSSRPRTKSATTNNNNSLTTPLNATGNNGNNTKKKFILPSILEQLSKIQQEAKEKQPKPLPTPKRGEPCTDVIKDNNVRPLRRKSLSANRIQDIESETFVTTVKNVNLSKNKENSQVLLTKQQVTQNKLAGKKKPPHNKEEISSISNKVTKSAKCSMRKRSKSVGAITFAALVAEIKDKEEESAVYSKNARIKSHEANKKKISNSNKELNDFEKVHPKSNSVHEQNVAVAASTKQKPKLRRDLLKDFESEESPSTLRSHNMLTPTQNSRVQWTSHPVGGLKTVISRNKQPEISLDSNQNELLTTKEKVKLVLRKFNRLATDDEICKATAEISQIFGDSEANRQNVNNTEKTHQEPLSTSTPLHQPSTSSNANAPDRLSKEILRLQPTTGFMMSPPKDDKRQHVKSTKFDSETYETFHKKRQRSKSVDARMVQRRLSNDSRKVFHGFLPMKNCSDEPLEKRRNVEEPQTFGNFCEINNFAFILQFINFCCFSFVNFSE